jgi:MerR family transcriptional regulator, thiopeptide resistance regulator
MQENYVKLLRPQARDLGKRDGRNSISAHNLTPNLTLGQSGVLDLAASQGYIVRVYGLTAGPLERDADGRAIHAEVQAGDQVIWLHPAGEQFQSPRTLGGVSSMTVIAVDDADAYYARSVEAGAVIIEETVDQNYGVREYGARDPEGQLWFFHSPLG